MKFRIMVKQPNQPVEEKIFEFKNQEELEEKELELMQGLVNGYIEVVRIGGDVQVILDEEGSGKNLETNCGFLGTVVFVKEDGEGWGSLTDEDVRKVKAWTVAHEHDQYVSGPIQILQGEAMINYKNRLFEESRKRQIEWDSF